MLPGSTVAGLTTPEKRSVSTFRLMPICFSPVTTRLPFGSTSITVVVIVPLNALSAFVPPLPSKSLFELPPIPSFGRIEAVGFRNGICATEPSTEPLRFSVLFELLEAVVFSWICTVRMSPTMRGLRSSNRPRWLPA